MLTLNKKYRISLILGVVVIFWLSAGVLSAQALTQSITQVKAAGIPTVYFLSWKAQVKKTYINAAAYLSYGNKWSDIKIVSAAELRSWPEAQLFKIAGAPALYYIQDNKKVLVQSLSDLSRFHLVGEPVLTVGELDLAQYQLVDYPAIGWSSNNQASDANGNSTSTPSASGQIAVYNDPVSGANNNSLVPNTTDNLLGVFRFQPSAAATISSASFTLSGIYNSDALDSFKAEDATGADYGANVSWRSSDHQVTVNFRPALNVAAGQTATVKVLADLKTCNNCSGQTLHLDLNRAADVTATLPAVASGAAWPLAGTTFKIVSVNNVIGQPVVQINSLATSTSGVGSGNRLISSLTIKETSGNEDVLIKQLTFNNNGSASVNDWNNFILLEDGTTVARVSALDNNGQIVFPINYLRVPAGVSVSLTVTAGLLSGYNPQATYSLQLLSLDAVGSTYNLTLSPVINNRSDIFTLN
jgi:hypothetical protein